MKNVFVPLCDNWMMHPQLFSWQLSMADHVSLFAGCRDARVMWDQKTGRSRGFGFVSFRNQQVHFQI